MENSRKERLSSNVSRAQPVIVKPNPSGWVSPISGPPRSMLPTFKPLPEYGTTMSFFASPVPSKAVERPDVLSKSSETTAIASLFGINSSYNSTPMQRKREEAPDIAKRVLVQSSAHKAYVPRHVGMDKLDLGSVNTARISTESAETSPRLVDENLLKAPSTRSEDLNYETRINELELSIKSADTFVKEFNTSESGQASVHQILKHCEAVASELNAQRQRRKLLEDRTRHLSTLLKYERAQREEWLVAFLQSLHSTLTDLTGTIECGLSNSSQLMTKSMDGTDEIMSHLIDRVDQLLIQKEGEFVIARIDEES